MRWAAAAASLVTAIAVGCEVEPSASSTSDAAVVEDRGAAPAGTLYTWVLIQDESDPSACGSGASPGVDVDAVLLSVGGSQFAFAEDASVTLGSNCPSNGATDPKAAEGASTGGAGGFVSLNGGSLRARIVGADSGLTMVIPAGAAIQIVEFDDGGAEHYRVSLCEDAACGGGGPYSLGAGTGTQAFTYGPP
jgi:hypothetical protein